MAVSGNVGEVQTAEPRVLPYQFEPPSRSKNRQEANATYILANDGYDRLGNSTWCECGNCAVMDKVEECNCCTESHEIMQKLTSRSFVIMTARDALQTGLWQTSGRVTVRVVLTITMDCTALLIIWAFVELIIKRERRRDSVLFMLSILYLSSLFLSVCFITCALYVPPTSGACASIVGLSHVAVICALAWGMLTSLQRLLTSYHLGPETLTSQWSSMAIIFLYLSVGYGVPCISLITLMTHFHKSNYIDVSMCWMSQDAIWWIVVPVLLFTGGNFAISIYAFGNQATPTDVKCYLYTCFILSVLFSFCNLLVQVDIEWPSDTNGYLLIVIMVVHNVIVWLHITGTLLELCPCAQVAEEQRAAPSTNRPQSIQLVATPATLAGVTMYRGDGAGHPSSGFSHLQDPGALQPLQQPPPPPHTATVSAATACTAREQDHRSISNVDDDMGALDEDDIYAASQSLIRLEMDGSSPGRTAETLLTGSAIDVPVA